MDKLYLLVAVNTHTHTHTPTHNYLWHKGFPRLGGWSFKPTHFKSGSLRNRIHELYPTTQRLTLLCQMDQYTENPCSISLIKWHFFEITYNASVHCLAVTKLRPVASLLDRSPNPQNVARDNPTSISFIQNAA